MGGRGLRRMVGLPVGKICRRLCPDNRLNSSVLIKMASRGFQKYCSIFHKNYDSLLNFFCSPTTGDWWDVVDFVITIRNVPIIFYFSF